MSNRLMRAALTVVAVLAIALPVAAQSKAAKPPRTPRAAPPSGVVAGADRRPPANGVTP